MKNFSAMYDYNSTIFDHVNISMSPTRYHNRTISIVGGHERDDYNLSPALSDERNIPLTFGAEKLIEECLTPTTHYENLWGNAADNRNVIDYKMDYSLDETRGIFEKLSKKMTERNYEGINKFYQNLDDFHNILDRIKPNDTEEEFIPENSTEIYSLYKELQNLEANYFSYYKKNCKSYQYFHWAKFARQGENLKIDHGEEITPSLSPHREAISKGALKENVITTYIEYLKEKNLIDVSVNDNEIKQTLQENANESKPAEEKTDEEKKYQNILNLYEVFEDDELYNNFSIFQDLINCSFNQDNYRKMYKSFDFGVYNKEGSVAFANPYYRRNVPEVIQKLVDNMHNVGICTDNNTRSEIAKKLKDKGIGNLISKSSIYSEISGKYASIVNDIIRAHDCSRDLVSENSDSLHDDVKRCLYDISRDYEVLKQVQSQIKDTYQFESEFDKNHPKTEIDSNRYLTQAPPFRKVFDLQSDEEHIRDLADCLATSHITKDDTSVSKK